MVQSLLAHQPYFIHFEKSNGLPSNACYDIIQDSKGFIWIANNEGLSRYDGFEFITYYNDAQSSTPGSNLVEDRYGRIWYQNFDGYLYYHLDDSLHAFNHEKPLGYYPFGITDSILWLVGKDDVIAYHLEKLTELVRFENKSHLVYSSGSNGKNFYITSDSGIYSFSPGLSIKKIEDQLISPQFFKLIFFDGDDVYIALKFNETDKIYKIINNKTEELFSMDTQISFIQGMYIANDEFWILTPKGVYTYLKNGKPKFDKPIFKGSSVSNVLHDFQNNYWFTSNIEGVFLVPQINNPIVKNLPFVPKKIIPHNDGFLLTSKDEGIYTSDKSFTTFDKIFQGNDNSQFHFIQYYADENAVFAISKNVYKIAPQQKTLIDKQKIATKSIVSIDEKYYAFAGSHLSGLMLKSDEKESLKSDWDDYFMANQNSILDNLAVIFENVRGKSAVYKPKENAIYLATNYGLFKVTPSEKTEILLNDKSIFADIIESFDDKLFLQTSKGKIIEIENSKAAYFQPTQSISNRISRLRIYDDKMFFKLENTLYFINLSNGKTEKIAVDIGLNANLINDYLVQNNLLILVTDNEIIKIDLNRFIARKSDFKLVLNRVNVNGEPLSNKQGKLRYFENNIEINYSLINFGATPPAVFYKINNSDWIPVSNNTRTLNFPALAPGNYTIQLMPENDISNLTTISFTIDAPLLKKRWFWVMILTPFFLMLINYYRVRINYLKKQNLLLKDKIELEQNLSKSMLTSIKSQMNPHFFYNALNTIQAYIFSNDKRNASKYLNMFSKLTRKILEMSEKDKVTLSEEIEALNLYLELEKMRFQENFTYTLTVDKSIETDFVEVPSMLLQPYVENAIKHGLLHATGEKTLLINIQKHQKSLKVIIEDNGIGRKKSMEMKKTSEHQSFATSANEKRLQIINKDNPHLVSLEFVDLYDEFGNATGTKVIINISLNH
jgi:sensor histidine kinase YesM